MLHAVCHEHDFAQAHREVSPVPKRELPGRGIAVVELADVDRQGRQVGGGQVLHDGRAVERCAAVAGDDEQSDRGGREHE